LTPRCQIQKFCFAFALSFLCPFSWPLGGHVRGGSLVKPVRGGADWHGARSTGIDRLDVASGERQHSPSFILWSILTTLTHTHLHQCSVSLVFISQRTPSGLSHHVQSHLALTPRCIYAFIETALFRWPARSLTPFPPGWHNGPQANLARRPCTPMSSNFPMVVGSRLLSLPYSRQRYFSVTAQSLL
jgi:hypothetical protein